MKKIFVTVILLVGSIFAYGQSQQQEEMVTVPKSVLSQSQIDQADIAASKKKAEQYGAWVGIGREIGVAVDSSLSAISTRANEFAGTTVGKWTIAIVILKIIGLQAMQFLVGLGLMFVGVPLSVWQYRKYLPKNVLQFELSDKDTGKVIKREYRPTPGDSNWRVGSLMTGCIIVVVALAVMFL